MHARAVLGVGKGVLFREVSSFQRLKRMQERYLGWEKVSCLERCPQFRSVLYRERGSTVCTFTLPLPRHSVSSPSRPVAGPDQRRPI